MIKQVVESNHQVGLDASSDKVFRGFLNHDALHCITHLKCHNSFSKMAGYVVHTYKPKFVLEFGSGAGDLSYFVRQFDPNVTYVSVDINREAANSPWYKGPNSYHFVARTDEPLHFVDDNNQTVIFDVILSFEHFEHISPETFGVFLDNMKKHMSKDTVVLCTAANVRCENVHINVKSKEDWNKYLTSQGFQMLDSDYMTVENQPFNTGIQFGFSKALSFKLQS